MKITTESNSIHRSGGSFAIPLRSFVASAVLIATTAFTSADVTLKGNVGARTINDDVIIARGTTCILNGTTIKGDVRVLSGARLYMNGAWVDGTVFAYRSLLVDLRDSSRVTWNVRTNRTRSVRVRGDSQIGGHMRLTNSTAPDGVDALLLRNSTIIGDVQARNGNGRMRVMDSQIEGKVKLVENSIGGYVIRNNEVWKSLVFLRNSGSAAIVKNTIGGNLMSSGNSPQPKIERNTVRGNTETDHSDCYTIDL